MPILAAASSACSASKTCSACSMRLSTSPMPRMRLAIRSGWKTSKSSSFSPVDAKRIGTPVTSRTDSAAPPRASPSSLVSTTPVKPTPSRNASAVATASWPIIASRTNSVSSGATASRMAAACRISSSSMPSRPAVSTITTSKCLAWPPPVLPRRRRPGHRGIRRQPSRCPGAARTPATPGPLAHDLQLVNRAGPLQVTGDQQRGVPLPTQPVGQLAGQRRLTGALQAGQHDHGRRCLGEASRRVSPPRMPTSSSLTILTTCWAGFSAPETSAPLARSLIAADERAHHRQRDVGLEQREPDLARGGVDVGVGQPALAAQALQGTGQPVGQRFEHAAQPSGDRKRGGAGRGGSPPLALVAIASAAEPGAAGRHHWL